MIDRLVEQALRGLEKEFSPVDGLRPQQLKFAEWLPREELEADINRRLIQAIQAWVEELACDAFAIQILGVSYLFAFADFSTSVFGLDECSESHPSARVRIILMQSMLEPDLLSFKEERETLNDELCFFGALWQHYQRWAGYVSDGPGNPKQPIYAIAQTAVTSIQNEIVAAARSLIPHNYNRLYDSRVDEVCKQLGLLVTCNEVFREGAASGEVADIDLILRASWGFALAEFPGWHDRYPDKSSCSEELSDLVLKSLELVELVKMVSETEA